MTQIAAVEMTFLGKLIRYLMDFPQRMQKKEK